MDREIKHSKKFIDHEIIVVDDYGESDDEYEYEYDSDSESDWEYSEKHKYDLTDLVEDICNDYNEDTGESEIKHVPDFKNVVYNLLKRLGNSEIQIMQEVYIICVIIYGIR